MRQRIDVGSMVLGIVVGVAGTFLIGAAAAPQTQSQAATSPVGRYQVSCGGCDLNVCAFVVDSVTGKVAIVPQSGSPNILTPRWDD